jgi:hypothetical protein
MRTWKILALSALSAAFLACPAPAADGQTELGKISQQLEAIRADLKAIHTQLKTLEVAAGGGPTAQVADLRRQIDELQARLARLDDTQRRAFTITPENEEGVRLPATGTIVLNNRSGVGGTFFVNSRAYYVPPFQRVRLPAFPSGMFTWQVSGDGGGTTDLRSRYLGANTIYYLNIDPS